jgi:hypothetical protein
MEVTEQAKESTTKSEWLILGMADVQLEKLAEPN